MKINWQIITFAVMLIAVSCSKEKQTMNNGLVIEDIKIGDGQEVEKFNIVTVNYTGLLENGTKFDSSLNPGRTPFRFTVGAGQVIKGWDEGLMGMKVGGKRKLTIPPELGYGSRDNGPIPANSTLIFEIDLLGIE
ncbi:MAG: peptidylprolyl isomerase [bacterium TMED250]|jgi:FKBP-type peptidyl-prolyl cis-trans isomerase FkpA|nr:peptidylprolyl isomerase [Alphaproteobacteria bacterium]OUX20419.1 MAG: peptidylprolyl isomerase [bacterium TMED250]|tara:strand:+ start:3141 stop:3545 length:405 start_codon:yes stop_codon:yes gene_type:complete